MLNVAQVYRNCLWFAHLYFPLPVSVHIYHKQKKNKLERNYSKEDFCYYCEKQVTSRVSKHYLSVHCDRGLVQEAIIAKGDEKIKKLYKLRHLGNFRHNTKVTSNFDVQTLKLHRWEHTIHLRTYQAFSIFMLTYLALINLDFGSVHVSFLSQVA